MSTNTATLLRPRAPTVAETEAKKFRGVKLTPVAEQKSQLNVIPPHITKQDYRLNVGGLVENPLSLSYNDLLALLQTSQLMMPTDVEGWGYTAKLTGPSLAEIFKLAGIKHGAATAVFHTADAPWCPTTLTLDHIKVNNVILALKDNDVTLTPQKGFPLFLAAWTSHGYDWVKWVTGIELSSGEPSNNSFRCSCYGHDWWWWPWLPKP
jgi:DMSO/TMAO reductase YedYZ molybdopterin-dependent catalytic subunit